MSASDLLRAFVAISLSDATRASIEAAADRLRGRVGLADVRWVRAENYHLTLHFFPGISAGSVEMLLVELRRAVACVRPFAIEAGALTWFPSPRRPRVVAVAVSGESQIGELAEAVEAAVERAGLPREKRALRPHVTVGRVRGAVSGAGVLRESAAGVSTWVDGVALLRSELRPSGAVYSVLGEARLNGEEETVDE